MGPARLRVPLCGHPPLLPFNLELMQYLLFPVLTHQGCVGDVPVGLGPLAIRLPLRLLVARRIELRRKAQVLIWHLIRKAVRIIDAAKLRIIVVERRGEGRVRVGSALWVRVSLEGGV